MSTAAVFTTTGTLAAGRAGECKVDPLTEEQAVADCAIRNERAVELGIETRYEVRVDGASS